MDTMAPNIMLSSNIEYEKCAPTWWKIPGPDLPVKLVGYCSCNADSQNIS